MRVGGGWLAVSLSGWGGEACCCVLDPKIRQIQLMKPRGEREDEQTVKRSSGRLFLMVTFYWFYITTGCIFTFGPQAASERNRVDLIAHDSSTHKTRARIKSVLVL